MTTKTMNTKIVAALAGLGLAVGGAVASVSTIGGAEPISTAKAAPVQLAADAPETANAVANANTVSVTTSNYFAAPYRAYDSREDTFGRIGNDSWKIDVSSDMAGNDMIPNGAKVVYYNITWVDATGEGFLAVVSGDVQEFPSTSTTNFSPHRLADAQDATSAIPASGPNAGKVIVAAGGGGSTHFIIDVVGYGM